MVNGIPSCLGGRFFHFIMTPRALIITLTSSFGIKAQVWLGLYLDCYKWYQGPNPTRSVELERHQL